MKQEQFIEQNIFNQLAIRGISKAKCLHHAQQAVKNWRQNNIAEGVKFNDLLANALHHVGKPVYRGGNSKMLFELITSRRCKRVYQTKRMWASWIVSGVTEEGESVEFRLSNTQIQRFVSHDLLIETEDEKELRPSDDVDWIPANVKKVAA